MKNIENIKKLKDKIKTKNQTANNNKNYKYKTHKFILVHVWGIVNLKGYVYASSAK